MESSLALSILALTLAAAVVLLFANILSPFLTPLFGPPKAYGAYLLKHSKFYQGLNETDKREFLDRVRDFIEEKDFYGIGIEVSEEMKLAVAAVAIQISFGLAHTIYIHFTSIRIFKSTYKKRNGLRYYGEVNPGFRSIMFSWERFKKGNANPNDGVNLGIHEMAHALWIEDSIDNAEYEYLNKAAKKSWNELAIDFISDQNLCKRSIFRNYACTNSSEFFAAAVEHFYERTEEFKQKEPVLFEALCRLLNQDPSRGIGRLERPFFN